MTIYTTSFYEGQAVGSQRSANVIVPIVLGLFEVRSVVDIGCGLGTWLKAFSDAGIRDYLGVDGDYVNADELRIPSSNFEAADLRRGHRFARQFDIACSLEVAEHLPESAADQFVGLLTQAAPRILFSAAIPGQGGHDHINEQWQSYWAQRFLERGYHTFDCIRPHVYGDPNVEWWYQQNILVFCKPECAPRDYSAESHSYLVDRVHPQLIKNWELAPHSGRQAMTAIGRGLRVLARKSSERLGLKANRAASPFQGHKRAKATHAVFH